MNVYTVRQKLAAGTLHSHLSQNGKQEKENSTVVVVVAETRGGFLKLVNV